MSGGEKLIKKVKRKTLFAYLKTGIKLPFFFDVVCFISNKNMFKIHL